MYGNSYNNPFNTWNPYTLGVGPQLMGSNQNEKSQQQSPIQNIFTSQPPQQNSFMACFVKDGENVATVGVYHKTAFIDIKNKKLTIKEINGDFTEYGLILPMDEKDKKINELEQKLEKMSTLENELNKLKEMIANGESITSNDTTSKEVAKSARNIKKSDSK